MVHKLGSNAIHRPTIHLINRQRHDPLHHFTITYKERKTAPTAIMTVARRFITVPSMPLVGAVRGADVEGVAPVPVGYGAVPVADVVPLYVGYGTYLYAIQSVFT